MHLTHLNINNLFRITYIYNNLSCDISNQDSVSLSFPFQTDMRKLGGVFIPYMHPKMHCKVAGKLFAAVIDRQNIDINFVFKAELAGLILDSGGALSAPVVPAQN